MRIAMDAMGGDHGSAELVGGAVSAVKQTDLEVCLVGDKNILNQHLETFSLSKKEAGRVIIVHSSEVVGMNEHPVKAIRKKKDASIVVAFDLARRGEVDGVVSAGNSGATLAAGIRKLGRLSGVLRPGIASIFPTMKKPVILMDIGANVDCKAQHLQQFGVMASAYSRLNKVVNPRVGLLTIGEETGKGNSLIKETYPLLEQSSLNFIGNVEGGELFRGEIDVIVCDGFVGNICLKVSEGLAEAAMQMLRDEIVKSVPAKVGYLLAKNAFKAFKKRLDYAEYGGAPLLGIDGNCIICHGTSNSQAVMNGIFAAAKMARENLNQDILECLTATKAMQP